MVAVHLGYAAEDFHSLLDGELFLPEKTWNENRTRCSAEPPGYARLVIFVRIRSCEMSVIQNSVGVRLGTEPGSRPCSVGD